MRVGVSTQDKPITLQKFGSGAMSILVVAGVHGDEIEGIEVAEELIRRIQNRSFTSLDKVTLWILPEANPDGTALKTRTNANNVDLNRNLPTSNWRKDASNPRYPPGDAPGSELETQAFLQIVEQVKPALIISLHSFSESLLLFPSYLTNAPYRGLVDEMAKSMNIPVTEKMNYDIFGSLSRWGYDNQIATLTVEILRTGFTNGTTAWADNIERFIDGIAKNARVQTIEEYVERTLDPIANQLDTNPDLIEQQIKTLLALNWRWHKAEFGNSNLEHVFSSSIALGFTLWQHLAAVERLSRLPDWYATNSELYSKLLSGELLCGLATTHLASANTISAVQNGQNFLITGKASWVSGSTFFNKLIVGFETHNEFVFSLIDFPKGSANLKIAPIVMSSMNGTSTATLSFDNFPIAANEIISRREKTITASPRPSSYVVPELGIVRACLKRLSEITKPKVEIAHAVQALEQKLSSLEHSRVEMKPNLGFEMAELVRDSLRLLTIVEGGAALKAGSFVSRTQDNILLLDVVLQTSETLNMKVQRIVGN